jgi:hypothetical protein
MQHVDALRFLVADSRAEMQELGPSSDTYVPVNSSSSNACCYTIENTRRTASAPWKGSDALLFKRRVEQVAAVVPTGTRRRRYGSPEIAR